MSDTASEKGRYSLVEVQFTEAREDYDPDYANAVVVMLALANTDDEFRSLVTRQLADDGFVLVDWGDITPFDPAATEWDEGSTQEAAARLSPEWPVQYVTFHRVHRGGLDA